MLLTRTERILKGDHDDISIRIQIKYKFLGFPIFTYERLCLVLPSNDESLAYYMHQRSAQTSSSQERKNV